MSDPHAIHMARALSLAAGAIGRTSPNPAVGALVVRDGSVVGEGATRPHGESHAEVVALSAAGARARGATLVVTLEPCDHHGRTPPCTGAILESGIARVVVATLDPNPRVAGRGVARLREAGIPVDVGLGSAAARTLMAGFATWVTTGRPHVIAKFAASLDGRIATRTGDSRWISGAVARHWAHGVRDRCDAILVGVGTVVADDPSLTARLDAGAPRPSDPLVSGIAPVPVGHAPRHPLRVVLDTHLRFPTGSRMASGNLAGATLVIGVDDGSARWAGRRAGLERPGTGPSRDGRVEVASVTAGADGRADVAAVLDLLGTRGITSVLVEGGGAVHDSFFRSGHVDRIAVVVAPMVVGGGFPSVGSLSTGVDRLSSATRLSPAPEGTGAMEATVLGDDVLLTGWVRRPAWPEPILHR